MVQLRINYWKIVVPQRYVRKHSESGILIKLGFKYDYDVKNYYMGGHEKKGAIWYIWNIIY